MTERRSYNIQTRLGVMLNLFQHLSGENQMKLKFIISSATILVIGVFVILNCKGKEKVCAVNSVQDLKNLFPTTVKEIENNLQKSKTIIEDTVNHIISIPNDKKTYQNSVLALDKMGYKLAPLTHIFEIRSEE